LTFLVNTSFSLTDPVMTTSDRLIRPECVCVACYECTAYALFNSQRRSSL